MVSLPSIRDMFPQFMSGKPNNSNISPQQTSAMMAPPQDVTRYDQSPNRLPPTAKPLFITKPIQPLLAYSSTTNWPQSPQFHTSSDGLPYTAQAPSNPPTNMRRQHPSVPPENSPEYVADTNSAAPTYSFGVFKSTADGSSLDHIASTTSLRRRRSTTGRQNFPADAVTLDSTLAMAPSSMSRSSTKHRFKRQGDGSVGPQVPPAATYSSTFMLSNPPNRSNTIRIGDQDTGSDGNQKFGEKGKVHECPHCSKRFNRPSSLQIHANTHTGARPFRCPHPNCGREFNVNSNMRRHYRNHARTTFSRTQMNATNSKSIRRRMEEISSNTLGLIGVTPQDAGSGPGRSYKGVLSFPPAQRHHMGDDSGEETSNDADDRMMSDLSESEWEGDPDDVEETAQWRRDDDCEMDSPVSSHRGDDFYHRQRNASPHSLGTSPKLCNSRRPQHANSSHRLTQTSSYPHSYTPSSAVYLQSCTDLNVSTVLRPAFKSRTPKEGLVW